jgi:CheY-like chemotaxis protein
MDGIQAARRIRQFNDPAKAGIPIIALTANALRGDGEKYKAAGMTDYLPKPIEESKLFHIISKNLLAEKTCDASLVENKPATEGNALPVQEERLYDLTMVRSVSGGDESFIKKMVDLFVETVPPNVSDLINASEKGDWDQVARLAHKLKSTVDSMGIKTLKTDIRTVEANAKQKIGLDEIAPLTGNIEKVISQCIVQLLEDFQ